MLGVTHMVVKPGFKLNVQMPEIFMLLLVNRNNVTGDKICISDLLLSNICQSDIDE